MYTATGEKSENIHAIYYADRAALMQIGQRSFAFRGAKSYNDLPDDIKKTRDTKHFKKNLYNYLLKL